VVRVRSGPRLVDVTVRRRPPFRRADNRCAGPLAPAEFVTESIVEVPASMPRALTG
jgi:hypothetical protein